MATRVVATVSSERGLLYSFTPKIRSRRVQQPMSGGLHEGIGSIISHSTMSTTFETSLTF